MNYECKLLCYYSGITGFVAVYLIVEHCLFPQAVASPHEHSARGNSCISIALSITSIVSGVVAIIIAIVVPVVFQLVVAAAVVGSLTRS